VLKNQPHSSHSQLLPWFFWCVTTAPHYSLPQTSNTSSESVTKRGFSIRWEIVIDCLIEFETPWSWSKTWIVSHLREGRVVLSKYSYWRKDRCGWLVDILVMITENVFHTTMVITISQQSKSSPKKSYLKKFCKSPSNTFWLFCDFVEVENGEKWNWDYWCWKWNRDFCLCVGNLIIMCGKNWWSRVQRCSVEDN